MTTYLTPSSGYEESRYYTLKSAIDLYGDCSQEVKSVYEAWYAIGVGISKLKISFGIKQYMPNCFNNYKVDFINMSDSNADFKWYFGDGYTVPL